MVISRRARSVSLHVHVYSGTSMVLRVLHACDFAPSLWSASKRIVLHYSRSAAPPGSMPLKGRRKLLLVVRGGVPCVRPISHRLRASAAATLGRFPAVALLLFICGRRAGGAAGDFLAVQSNSDSVAATRKIFHIVIALIAAGCRLWSRVSSGSSGDDDFLRGFPFSLRRLFTRG